MEKIHKTAHIAPFIRKMFIYQAEHTPFEIGSKFDHSYGISITPVFYFRLTIVRVEGFGLGSSCPPASIGIRCNVSRLRLKY